MLSLAITFLVVTGSASADTIPLQPTFTDYLIVLPYTSLSGEARAEFLYVLDGDDSYFNATGLSGMLSIDVPQSAAAGDFANEVNVGFHALDSNEFTLHALWSDFTFRTTPLEGITLFASGDALSAGEGNFHLSEFPDYEISGNLAFDTTVPLPAAWLLFVSGMCGLGLIKNRRGQRT